MTRSRSVFALLLSFDLTASLTTAADAQDPRIYNVTPANGATVGTASVQVLWSGCSNGTITTSSPQSKVNGIIVPTNPQGPNWSGCELANKMRYSTTANLTPGTNWIDLKFCTSYGCGYWSMTLQYVPPTPGIAVTPDGVTTSAIYVGGSGSYTFRVTNTGNVAANPVLSVSCSSQLTSCYFPYFGATTGTGPLISAGAYADYSVYYAGATGGTGVVTVTAYWQQYTGTSNTGTLNVPVNGVATVAVSLGNSNLMIGSQTTATARTYASDGTELTGRSVQWSSTAHVSASPLSGTSAATTNITAQSAGSGSITATSDGVSGSASITVQPPVATIVVAITGANPIATGQTTTATARTFAANGVELFGRGVTWGGSGLSPSPGWAPSVASTTVTAQTAGTQSLTATSEGVTGSANIVVVDGATRLFPVLQLAYSDTYRDVSKCIASCFSATAAYSPPSYRSVDVDRTVTLVYRSDRAHPIATVQVDATDNSAVPASSLSLQLRRSDGSFVTFVNGSGELHFAAGSGVTRLAGQFNATSIPTSAPVYTAVVRARWSDGFVRESTTPARVLIVNGGSSEFGAGWDIANMQRIHFQSDGVMVVSGDGSASFFANCSGTCVMPAPFGDFSKLSRLSDGTYERRYPDGTVFRFNAAGELIWVADRYHTFAAFNRAGGRLSSITDPTGASISFQYDGSNRLWRINMLSYRSSQFVVNGSGDLIEARDPDNVINFSATYASHRLTGMTDANGGVSSYTYSTDGNIEHAYAPAVNVSGQGMVTPRSTFAGPGKDILVRIAENTQGSAAIPVTRGLDLRASITNPRNYTTYFTITKWGAPSRVDYPLGLTSTASYDPVGRVTSTTSQSGETVNYTWIMTPAGPAISETHNVTTGQHVYTSYDSDYNRATHIWGDVREQRFYYTGARTDSMKIGAKPALKYVQDSYGRVTQVIDGASHLSFTWTSSSGLRNTDSVVSGGRRTRLRRDENGRIIVTVHSDGTRDSVTYTPLNRILTSTDALGRTTAHLYYGMFLTGVVDANSQIYSFERDAFGRIEREYRAGSSVPIRYEYDANGNPVKITNRRGQEITMQYDALDRLTARTADGITTSFSYVVATPSSEGYMSRVNSESADTSYVNAAGRVVRSATGRAGNWYRIAYTYLPDGRVTTTTATSNRWIGDKTETRTYSPTWQLQYLDNWAGRSTFTQNDDDITVTTRYPNGMFMERSINSLHTSYEDRFTNNAAVDAQLGRGVSLDTRGRVAERFRPAADTVHFFAYDSVSRLRMDRKYLPSTRQCGFDPDLGFVCTGSEQQQVEITNYTYDAVGNPTSGVTQIDVGNRTRAANGYAFDYDPDGNLISKQGPGFNQTLEWNSLGQLTRVTTNGSVVQFGYDASGRRVRKTVNGSSTLFLHKGEDVFLKLDANGAPATEYSFLGLDHPLMMTEGGETYYVVLDPVGGSVKGLVRHSNQTVAANITYSAYGAVQSGTNVSTNTLWFGSHEYDWETQLVYVRARYYDPFVGRFVSEDPIGLNGGINLYTYADGDPINGRDPMGTFTLRWGITWRNPWRDVLRWAPAVAFVAIGLGPASWLAAGEVMAASAAGAAGAALIERTFTGADFGSAFQRNWGISSLNIVALGAFGGGIASANARNLFQGEVTTIRKSNWGALTLGSSTGFDGFGPDQPLSSILKDVPLWRHELGHVVQFGILSAFRGNYGLGPWVAYGGLGLLGLAGQYGIPVVGWIGCAWEGMATGLGNGARNSGAGSCAPK